MSSTAKRSPGNHSGEPVVRGDEVAEESTTAAVEEIMELVRSEDEACRVQAAMRIRRLTKTSSKNRRKLAEAVDPLVSMLLSPSEESCEAAILALLNLAVRDERNKIKIVDAGALELLVGFLKSANSTLQEHATAAILTLSASSANKTVISKFGAIPLLVKILKDGNEQAKNDAVMALCNLSTSSENLRSILSFFPVPYLIGLLKNCKKSSKQAEKCSALLESLLAFEEGRTALISEQGGMLAMVEVLEIGSPLSREHVVGALLTMCQSNRSKYREPILKEGAIPGLLELTVIGTPKARIKAHLLLELLRSSPVNTSELQVHSDDRIVNSIISKIDRDDRTGKAKKMLAEMVQVSMEQSLRHLHQRAFLCTPSDLPLGSCPSEVSSK